MSASFQTILLPKESGQFVANLSKTVSVNDANVEKLAALVIESIQRGDIGMKAFMNKSLYPTDSGLDFSDLLNWTFITDTLNFNFWIPDGEPKFTVTYNGEKRVGYLAMINAVNRAINEGRKLYKAEYCAKLDMKQVQDIFRSDTVSQMPLLMERLAVLLEVSEVLLRDYAGSFENVLKEAKGDGLELIKIVVKKFPCFRDEALYEGQKIAFYKRAQILASDVDMLLVLRGKEALRNIDKLTMFADYRVPQVLHFFGVLEYSPELLDKLKAETLLLNGCEEEVEIRGCSIEAVERIVSVCRDQLREKGYHEEDLRQYVRSSWVDYFLWEYRLQHARQLASVPYHRTRCIYY